MKKFILSLVAVFAISVSSFAAVDNDVKTLNNKMNKMESYLQMDGYQTSVMKGATVKLQDALQQAVQESNEETKAQVIKKAVEKNLKQTSRVLSMDQYKRYLRVLNSTLQNAGLDEYTR
jgi:hypothetical protein